MTITLNSPTPGCLLQSPIGFKDAHGNDFTLGCFANATWVDPILHFGMFHLANPYAQIIPRESNRARDANPRSSVCFPVNINVDLNDDGLQLNFAGGASWNLGFDQTGITSSRGPSFADWAGREISRASDYAALRVIVTPLGVETPRG